MSVCLPALDSVQDGATALLVASEKGHCEVVSMLLENKADVNMKDNVSESSNTRCTLSTSGLGDYKVAMVGGPATD